MRRLVSDISWEYPLVKGVHRDGVMVFTFRGNMDWDQENLYTIPATELSLSLKDTFDQEHTATIEKFDIHAGTLCKPGDRNWDPLL